ncbi:hypothetical protein OAB57_00970 [Bacteriovoracaceae bacterium]|nr:hypothetical protein [Bacteriovoracaceae bacterium]
MSSYGSCVSLVNRENILEKSIFCEKDTLVGSLKQEGLKWDSSEVLNIPKDFYLVIDFGSPVELKNIIIQSDNNDDYYLSTVEYFDTLKFGVEFPNVTQKLIGIAKSTYEHGVRSRLLILDQKIKSRYLMVKPKAGDQKYSFSGIMVFPKDIQKWKHFLNVGPIWTKKLRGKVDSDAKKMVLSIVGLWIFIFLFLITSKNLWEKFHISDLQIFETISFNQIYAITTAFITIGIVYWSELFKYLIW